jgi:predicted negative regulator of RcsB-dependent stress response
VSDYLTDDEQLARLRSWWQRNGTALVIGLVLVIGGVVGWRWYQSSSAERLARTADLFAEFGQARGEARAALAADIVASGRRTAYPALALLQLAEEAATSGDLAAASELLRDAIAQASGRPLADLARLRLARVLHALDLDEDAIRTLAEIRATGYVSIAQELKGDIHLTRNERLLAHAAYVAALAEVLAEDQRPLLEIKVADTADASGS